MLERFRAAWSRVMAVPAGVLLRLGVSPDVVTWVGTAGVVLAAVICLPQGWLWQGALVIALFAMSDMVDGQMARMSDRVSSWGAFLDSTLDRLADGAVFAAVALHLALAGRPWWAAVALWVLVFGQLTSYVKARAEAVGYQVRGGVAARADRILIILLGLLLSGLGVPWVLEGSVVVLAVLCTVTVAQRMVSVRKQIAPTAGTRRDHGVDHG